MEFVRGHNEEERLSALHDLRILEAESLPEIEALVAALAAVFEAPMAFLSFVGKEDLLFRAGYGVTTRSTPREGTFCEQAILSDDLTVVRDALEDERFRNSALVSKGPKTRFYAGYPLSLDGRNTIGTLCVVDTRPRDPSTEQLEQLRRLGTVVLGLLRSHLAQNQADRARSDAETRAPPGGTQKRPAGGNHASLGCRRLGI